MRTGRLLGTSVVFAACAFAQAEFEVASVKPSEVLPAKARNKPASLRGDAGRLDWVNVPMRQIIALAYQLKEYQISGPDWLRDYRFDLQAKLPDGTTEPQKWAMLQTLLAKRFGLAAHRDREQLPVYGLTVGKGGPKLKEHVENSGDPAEAKMSFGRIEAQGESVADLVEMLTRMMERPVVDETGLTGKYDITLNWTPEPNDGSFIGMKIGMARDAGQKVELPPSKGPNLLLAVQQQLGLKLDPKKLPVEILVVDRAEKVPVEN